MLSDHIAPALIEYVEAVVTEFLMVVGVTSAVNLLVDYLRK
ncbi:hypothetical protein [Nitrosomonas marina]|uniref:Uncharacterized protein n=1 Tax=Nitrosomonas marina TaxID=917 RepID=A0A1H8J407_9PROT|nr:hypothetical protein [Nitrosomonas marina]SEN75673.1 hypothetical protein SAMN05216325_1545 [Nitrosomonas marina]